MATHAAQPTPPLEAGANLSAPSYTRPTSIEARAEIIAITTQDDFLLELGAVLGATAAVHPVESLALALERMAASHLRHILIFDTRGMAELRNCVGRAYARAPHAAILLFAQATDEESMRRAFKGSKVFAVLPIPLDAQKTALAYANALTEVLGKDRSAPAPPSVAPVIPEAVSIAPGNDRWGLGAGLAVLVLACAWFSARDKHTAPPSAARAAVNVAPSDAPSRNLESRQLPMKAAAQDASSTHAPADLPYVPADRLRLLNYIAPRYPSAARSGNASGTVIVAYTVDAQGATRDVRVESAEPSAIFNRNAVDAVKRWRYAPAMLDDTAVAVATRTVVRFAPP